MESFATSEYGWPASIEIARGAQLVVNRLENSQIALLPAEEHLAIGVTQARLRELQAGRAAARDAIRRHGGIPQPILMAPSGAPIWPENYCGSLSHTSRYVAALITSSSEYTAAGVDIDDGRPLGNAVANVATVGELDLVHNLGSIGETTPECAVFSIKEAIFKCQCPITGDESLDFLHVRLRPGLESGSLRFEVVDTERRHLVQLSFNMQIYLHVLNGVTTACALSPRQ